MKKKHKRKKSSARRGPDTSEEESDMESKVFLPSLCKKKQKNSYSKCALNYFSPRRKREDWRMMETRIRWFSPIHLLTSENIRTWKSRSSYHFPMETNARFWREASQFHILIRSPQAFILMMRPASISNQAVQHFSKPQNYLEYRALDLTRFFWTKITIWCRNVGGSLSSVWVICSLSVRPPHLTPFLPVLLAGCSPVALHAHPFPLHLNETLEFF